MAFIFLCARAEKKHVVFLFPSFRKEGWGQKRRFLEELREARLLVYPNFEGLLFCLLGEKRRCRIRSDSSSSFEEERGEKKTPYGARSGKGSPQKAPEPQPVVTHGPGGVRMLQMTNGWVKIEQPTGKPYYHHKADKVRNVLVYGNIEFDNIMCMTSDRYFGFKLLV